MELLIEIYSEEIPARMQNKAAADFKKILVEFFTKQNIKFSEDKINSYITLRRLAIVCEELEEFQIISASKKIGPKIDAAEKAIEGFLKSVGLDNINQLEKIENQNGFYYCYNSEETKTPIIQILQKNLPHLLQKMSSLWSKSMRWKADKSESRWVRPIRNILCIFDKKIIDFKFAGLNSNNKTFGHLFLSNGDFTVENFENYQQKLKDNFVILDSEIRKKIIIDEIKSICEKINCVPFDNLTNENSLLNEVVGLVEYPEVLLGEIDQKFMSLPYEVLVLTVKLHQKYFCVKDQNGNLAPYFIFVSNIKADNKNKIISDNKKVLTARLSDAKFFIDEDLKIPLIQRLEGLKNIIFHEKIGSVYDKIKRLEVLNKFVVPHISGIDLILADKLTNYAKNDLITKAVAELPELQGVIGKYYAKMEGHPKELSDAIAEQYLPVSASGDLPQTKLGILLSITDKIDTICGLFLVDEKPTSSKDPFALRRSALGIIRIMIHYQINLPIKNIIEESLNSFSSNIIEKLHPKKTEADIKIFKQELVSEIISFFIERLKFFLKDNLQLRSDVVNEVFDHKEYDLTSMVDKAKFINGFILEEKNIKIIELYKRAANIVSIEEKKDQKQYDGELSGIISDNKCYQILQAIKKITPEFNKFFNESNYDEAIARLAELEVPLNNFFDNVIINCEEKNLRINRLMILAAIRNLFNQIFNFSKIEIKKNESSFAKIIPFPIKIKSSSTSRPNSTSAKVQARPLFDTIENSETDKKNSDS